MNKRVRIEEPEEQQHANLQMCPQKVTWEAWFKNHCKLQEQQTVQLIKNKLNSYIVPLRPEELLSFALCSEPQQFPHHIHLTHLSKEHPPEMCPNTQQTSGTWMTAPAIWQEPDDHCEMEKKSTHRRALIF